MKKIIAIIKNWSVVILLSLFIATMVCAFLCCVLSKGWLYPVFGAVGVAGVIATSLYQLIVEIKLAKGLS